MNGDRTGEFGTIYLPALRRIRTLWLDLEPLVAETSYDDPIDPTELRIQLTDGLDDADGARFDVQWSVLDNYSFHHVDSEGVNWRFDRRPNTHSLDRHFHPPPAARPDESEPSCIAVEEVSLARRGVHTLWRAAYESGGPGRLNDLSNPP